MPINSSIKNFEPSRQTLKKQIKLLSGGYFDRASIKDGIITVYPWDIDHDAWFQSRLREPKAYAALWELAGKLCNSNGCPISKFPIGDINTILLVSRSLGLDSETSYIPTCTACGRENSRVVIKIPDELEKVAEKPDNYPGWDEFELPVTKDVVRLRPLTVGDEIAVADRSEEGRKLYPDRMMRMLCPVVSIGGGIPDGPEELMLWWNSLHPKDKYAFTNSQDSLYPHLNTEVPHECDSCKAKFVHQLNIGIEFFR